MPRLKGKRLSAAKAAPSKAHCALGKVTRKRAKGRPGRVIRQSLLAGVTRPAGSKGRLVLSKRR